MSVQYRIKTAQTANFPPRFVLAPFPGQEAEGSEYFGGANAAAVVGAPKIDTLPRPLDLAQAISVDQYPHVSTEMFLKNFGIDSWTQSSPATVPLNTRENSNRAMLQFGAQSSTTEPSANTAKPILSSSQSSTNTMLKALIVSSFADALAKKQAVAFLAAARAAARAGNMREAYHSVYRGLDALFRRAQWNEVTIELEEICSSRYPAMFAIGAMRFASPAAKHISDWDNILRKLTDTAQRQKIDVGKAMRGLV